VEPTELQRLLITEVMADNAARFAATLGARNPRLCIFRFVYPELSVWEVLTADRLTLTNFVFAMGARANTRLLLGLFEFVPTGDSLRCALASRDDELIREIWVHTPEEVRTRFVGLWLATAAAFQLEVPFRWLLGLANDANLDEAVEVIVRNRLVGALCEVEATGFDLTRIRPARALAGWNRTMSLATIRTPSLPSVSASTLLAWHVGALRSWDIPCDEPKALANGRVVWTDLAPRIDIASWAEVPAQRVMFLAQTLDGVVFGFFANCPLSGAVQGRDPALMSAIFVLEHPTDEQRKWQLQNPNYDVAVSSWSLRFGRGMEIHRVGAVLTKPAPEFGMAWTDAIFVSLQPAGDGGWSSAQIGRWELWSV
jgi:hypothetical protein